MTVRPIDGTWSKFVWNLSKSESLARKFRDGKACLIDLRLAVEDQPTLTPPNEWVSVDEGLPEPTYCVLVYTADCSIEVDAIGSDGEWMSFEVTHWMPLPEPPDRRPPEGGEINKITVVQHLGRLEDVAFRPVSREQVEKVWTGCEKCHNQDNWPSWIIKGFVYCPKCGTPLASWAWEKQMERLEALKDG